MPRTFVWLCVVISVLSVPCEAQELLDAKPIAKTVIKVVREPKIFQDGPDVFDVVIDDRKVYVDRSDVSVGIQGVYEATGRSFALIWENDGGNACPALFRAIDVTSRVFVSKEFGTCSEHPAKISVEAGKLVVVLPKGGRSRAIYRFYAGILTETDETVPYASIGPKQAPDNDIAALVDGKYIYEAVNFQAVAITLEHVMGKTAWTQSRDLVRDGADLELGGKFESRGDFDVAGTCVPHECTTDGTEWAFDHFGHAWASWSVGGKTKFFGSPPDDVKRALSLPTP